MRFFILAAAILNVALAGHVAVRMPFLNSAGVTYVQGQYDPYHQQQFAYAGPQYEQYAYPAQAAYAAPVKGPVSVGYAQVPVKTHVEVPTVQHVSTVTDVPVTKIVEEPAVVQSVVDVAKPAVKTRKFEVRRPAIQKQFYDIEERVVIRPVGSALVELDEPLTNGQTGPSFVQSLDDPHDISVSTDHKVPISAVAPPSHTVAITPVPHHVAVTPTPHTVAITPAVHHHVAAPVAIQKEIHYASTPSPLHVSTPIVVSTTPQPIHEYAHEIEASARHHAIAEQAAINAQIAHEEAYARARYASEIEAHSHRAALAHQVPIPVPVAVESHHQHAVAVEAHHPVVGVKQSTVIESDNDHEIQKAARNLNHLHPSEAHENQRRLIDLLTARGGVAEVGFGKAGYSEPVGDAGITRARVLSATPSPIHHQVPVEEKVNTRRVVVSRPVQTLQEIDVVEPVAKLEKVAINQPTVIKTAKVGYERVETSVPVLGKSIAETIGHAHVPVGYYHHK